MLHESIIVHDEKDWKSFFESLQFASIRLTRLQSSCIIPDTIFIERSFICDNNLTWYRQQKTQKGEGIYKVSSSNTSPRAIMTRLERHVQETFGETITPQSQKYAAIGMYPDRIELLKFCDVSSILSEATNLPSTNSTVTTPLEECETQQTNEKFHRPRKMPFCLYFLIPPVGSIGKRYVGTSMSSQRDGTLLGQNTDVTMSFDWYKRRNLSSVPQDWTNNQPVKLQPGEAGADVDDDTARRAVAVGMRQICRCLAMPRFDVDKRFNIRGAILEFTFDRNQSLCFSGIVSLTTMVDKPINKTSRTTIITSNNKKSVITKRSPIKESNIISTFSLTNPLDNSPRLPSLSANSSSELLNSHSEFITMDEFSTMSNDETISKIKTATPKNNINESSYFLTPPQLHQHTQQHRKIPKRPDTAPIRRRFTTSGRPMPSTRRIGGGHTYTSSVENMTSTRYTGIGSNTYHRGDNCRFSGKKRTKSILLAYGARHCDPPALVAMAHQIDSMNGDLQNLIQIEKNLKDEILQRDHMLSVSNDSTQQLNLRVQYLEKNSEESMQAAKKRETELLTDLHDTSKKLEKITKEHDAVQLILQKKESKLIIMQTTATEERETIMKRMVEYDHNNRNLRIELEKRDNEIKSISTGLANEKAANEALKMQLASLQDQIDSMGTSNALAEAEVNGLTQERNSLYRNTTGDPPPMQFKRGPSFKLYAWDIMASHPNPKAELEIVFSIFHHFNITVSQIYVHYATSSSTAFSTGIRRGPRTASRGLIPSKRKDIFGSCRLRLLMTKSDFRQFCQESKIWDHPLFSWAFIDLAYDKSIQGGTSKGGREVVLEAKAKSIRGSKKTRKQRYLVPNGTMTKRDFKEALIRISYARFPQLSHVGEKLECLFEKHIIPYCEKALTGGYDDDCDDDIVRLAEKYGSEYTSYE
jgi:hypothetical protein